MEARRGRPPHPEAVTPAEAKVLTFVRGGFHNAEIAVRLGISVNTVRFHVSNLLAKSGCPDRGALKEWYPPGIQGAPRSPLAALLVWKLPAVAAAVGVFGVAIALAIAAFTATGERGGQETGVLPAARYSGAVIGVLTREAGSLVVTEEGTDKRFGLSSEMAFARWIGQRVFIVGTIDGSELSPVSGSPIGANSRCNGRLIESKGRVSVGGSCHDLEIDEVPAERLLALRSERVSLSVSQCTRSRDGRPVDPPLDLFGEEREHPCPAGVATN